MLKRLDNIGIAVSNAKRSLEFYTGTLGFEGAVTEGEGSARLGDVSLYIFESKSGTHSGDRTTDYYQNPVGLDHLAFEVEDIIEESKVLEQRGVVFDQDVVGEPGSFRYRGFRDPDGNMIYIIQKG